MQQYEKHASSWIDIDLPYEMSFLLCVSARLSRFYPLILLGVSYGFSFRVLFVCSNPHVLSFEFTRDLFEATCLVI